MLFGTLYLWLFTENSNLGIYIFVVGVFSFFLTCYLGFSHHVYRNNT